MNGGRRTVDVSALPAHGFGLDSVLIWGALVAIAIEGTMMALALVSFVYYRGNYQVWPPSGVGPAAFDLALAQMVVLLLSLPPTIMMNGAAVRERFPAVRRWLVVATVLSVVVTVLRALELPRVAFRWDQHAYGSAFWLVLGIHVTHIVSGVAEFLMLLALMTVGRDRFERKHFSDVQAAGILWYFVVIEWMIAYPVLYLMPLGVRR
jgi:heme/copper-type cytochrome/quinol oxidase subunit 3